MSDDPSDTRPSVQLAILQYLREHSAATASQVSEIYPQVTRSCQDPARVTHERRLNWARVHLCHMKAGGLVDSRPAVRPDGLRSRGIYKLWELTPAGARLTEAT